MSNQLSSVSGKDSKFEKKCTYNGYHCLLGCVGGFKYCIRHILEDKAAPFKQCNFSYQKTAHRCFRAAPTSDRYGFCQEHSAEMLLQRQKVTAKTRPPDTPETYLGQLSHHRKMSNSSIHTVPDHTSVPSVASKALEYSNDENDENIDISSLDVMKLPRMDDDSDADIGSDSEFLDHAEIFTSEEVVKVYIDKLKQLKESYIEEFQNLGRELKENRKDYLKANKVEKETMMSIHDQPKETASEQDAYRELVSLGRYHKNCGMEALLKMQYISKQAGNENIGIKSPLGASFVKCNYSEGSYKCGDKSVPMSKFCFKHILSDNNQVLFKKCNSVSNEEECPTPVPQVPNSPSCVYHLTVPSIKPLTTQNYSDVTENVGGNAATVNLSESSAFVVSELPPEHVMEGEDDAPKL